MQAKSLVELENLLINGFHDALLEGVSLFPSESEASLDLQIFVGDLDADTIEKREKYRKARIFIKGLYYFCIDTQTEDLTSFSCPSRIEGGEACETSPPLLRPRRSVPEGAAYWFFVNDWNSFIHIAAKEASLEWLSQDG